MFWIVTRTSNSYGFASYFVDAHEFYLLPWSKHLVKTQSADEPRPFVSAPGCELSATRSSTAGLGAYVWPGKKILSY